MRRRLLLPLLLACLLPSVALADEEAPKHALPEVRPIQLDGRPAGPEWADALGMTLSPGTTIRMQQFRGTVMVALISDRIWPDGSVLTLFLCPNGPKAGGRGPGCLRIDYEPFRHDRPHVIAYRYDAEGVAARVDGSVVARQSIGNHGSNVELVFPAKLLGLTKEKRFPVRFCAQWARAGARAQYYPQGLDFQGTPGKPPVDFVSAGRWAMLDGFGDASGPGAFPAAEWERWVEHDAELYRRGRTAHDRVALLREEWKKEDKRDTEMLEEVVGNLAWVRKHEPLTADDILVMATLWRYLGMHDHAIGALTTLADTSRSRAHVMRALHERAMVFRAAERYDEEKADWDRLAEMTGAQGAGYTRQGERAAAQKALWDKEQEARQAIEQDPSNPLVRLDTARGPVLLVLHAKKAPEAVKQFLALVGKAFYDGTNFHRVKGDFMAQGGDPKSRPGGGPAATEFPMETNDGHDFFRGALCYARPPHKEINGSQFFIMNAPKPGMGTYTIFGHVVSGMQAVDRLEKYDELVRAVVVRK